MATSARKLAYDSQIVAAIGESASSCWMQILPNSMPPRTARLVTTRLDLQGRVEPLYVGTTDDKLITRSGNAAVIASAGGDFTLLRESSASRLPTLVAAQEFGMLRRLARVGDQLIAVGMAHQIHCLRDGDTEWTTLHVDTVQQRSRRIAAGFNAIAGLHSDHWVAAGFVGIIAQFEQGQLTVTPRATNVALFDACYEAECGFLVCGQRGVLLARPPGAAVWDTVSFEGVQDDLIGVRFFKGLYLLLCRRGLWVARRLGGPAEPAAITCPSQEFISLDVCADTLWVFTALSVFVSADAQAWTRAVCLDTSGLPP